MDYSRRELADRLASEYVLGTLQGSARRRFESLLSGHPLLRECVIQWQARLSPLAASIEPVEPSPRVWQGIEAKLFASQAQQLEARARLDEPWWRRLNVWRAASGLATLALAAVLVIGPPKPPASPAAAPIIVVLNANPQVAQAVQARFVASLSPDGRALVLRAIDAPPLTAQQALELWAVPPTGAPRSLGLVKADGATTLMRAQLLLNTAAFAVSVEPAGGSPTGAPTGPIVSLGKLQI
jgi:anti-sigma-K factor RskA